MVQVDADLKSSKDGKGSVTKARSPIICCPSFIWNFLICQAAGWAADQDQCRWPCASSTLVWEASRTLPIQWIYTYPLLVIPLKNHTWNYPLYYIDIRMTTNTSRMLFDIRYHRCLTNRSQRFARWANLTFQLLKDERFTTRWLGEWNTPLAYLQASSRSTSSVWPKRRNGLTCWRSSSSMKTCRVPNMMTKYNWRSPIKSPSISCCAEGWCRSWGLLCPALAPVEVFVLLRL